MQEPEYEQMNAQERVSMIWMTDVLLKRFLHFLTGCLSEFFVNLPTYR